MATIVANFGQPCCLDRVCGPVSEPVVLLQQLVEFRQRQMGQVQRMADAEMSIELIVALRQQVAQKRVGCEHGQCADALLGHTLAQPLVDFLGKLGSFVVFR